MQINRLLRLHRANLHMVTKLGVIVLGMFCFGYALVPIYKAICEMTGVNILALGDRNIPGATATLASPPLTSPAQPMFVVACSAITHIS